MTPGKYDLELYRGDTYRWKFQLWEDEARTEPVDLAGAAVEAEIRNQINGAMIVHMDCTVTLPNIIVMELKKDMWTSFMDADLLGVWDLEVTFPGDEVQTQLAGQVRITADVTNSRAISIGARSIR